MNALKLFLLRVLCNVASRQEAREVALAQRLHAAHEADVAASYAALREAKRLAASRGRAS